MENEDSSEDKNLENTNDKEEGSEDANKDAVDVNPDDTTEKEPAAEEEKAGDQTDDTAAVDAEEAKTESNEGNDDKPNDDSANNETEQEAEPKQEEVIEDEGAKNEEPKTEESKPEEAKSEEATEDPRPDDDVRPPVTPSENPSRTKDDDELTAASSDIVSELSEHIVDSYTQGSKSRPVTGVTKDTDALSDITPVDTHSVKGDTHSVKGDASSVKGDGSEVKENENGATTTDKTEEGSKAGDDSQAKDGASKAGDKEGSKADDASKVADGEDPNTRGDEAEIASTSQHGEHGEDEEKIPEDFFYDKEEHVSKASTSEESGLPNDLLSLNHSFGFDCQKRSNLHLLDENTVLFAAGNLVQILNVKTKEQIYLRSTSGGGIGALAVHPSQKYFAVAEKGVAPNINIYEFPSLKLVRILRGGTQEAYAYIDFSPDGKTLASVGGDPDYMLTLWDWKQETTVLRSKAFSQDVFRVTFSTELEGQLTSSGTGHIRFWKMAKTFTGLKLQGQLGKFGKTEISDIEGYVELPDGKVLSGAENGNMLLWDGGLIKTEISRRNKKPCHQGPIQQIVMDEGELMTVGIDGCIRVWDFESIDTADASDAGIFEMEPMNELKVGNDVQLKSMVKVTNMEEPVWYAQDGNGGIWKLDLSFSHTSLAPEKVMSYHAGAMKGLATSPVTHLVATTGDDKTVRVFDYKASETMCETRFNAGGSALIWAPKVIDPKGSTLIAGFGDGVVRVLNLQKFDPTKDPHKKYKYASELTLKQALKPHKSAVTCMHLDPSGELLATGGDDATVFFMAVSHTFDPIGFVKVPAPVTHMQWTPQSFKRCALLVFCSDGSVVEIEAPEPGKFDTSHTYEIEGLKTREHKFKSIKSRLRHEEELAIKAKIEEEKQKKKEEERRKRAERGLEEEEEEEEEEEKEPEPEWKPYIPEEPNAILCGLYSDEDKFWMSMDNFDAGYLYQCKLGTQAEREAKNEETRDEPVMSIPVFDSSDTPITTIRYSSSGKYLIMGMKDGAIRIVPLHDENNLDSVATYWTLNMHDNNYGQITHIDESFDGKYLFSVGADGNIFSFNVMDQASVEDRVKESKAKIPSARKAVEEKRVEDIEDPSAYSIEDAKQKAEHDKMMRLAEEKKTDVKRTIAQLRRQFKKLIERNVELPAHLRLDRKEFEMDPEIKKELERQTQEKKDITRKELSWEKEKHRIALEKLKARFKDVVECERIVLKAFKTSHEVTSFRASKLSDDFYELKAEMERRKTTMLTNKGDMSREHSQLTGQQLQQSKNVDSPDGIKEEKTEAKIFTSLKGSMGERISKALIKVEEKKKKRQQRRDQWNDLNNTKPDEDYEDPADIAAIKEAQENMGDYKLKSADDYVVPDHLRMNAEKARNKLLLVKDLIHRHKYDFNQRLLKLRDKKLGIIDEIREIVGKLEDMQNNLEEDQRIVVPEVPRMYPEEVPEKRFEYTRDQLLAYKAEQTQANNAAQSGFGGGFGGGGAKKPSSPGPYKKQDTNLTGVDRGDTTLTQGTEDMGEREVKLTPLEIQIKMAQEIRNLYERDRMMSQINELLENFDAELRLLRHDKFRLDVDLKNADLRHVTLFEELILLKEFEKRENLLTEKQDNKEQEKIDMQVKIMEVQQKLDMKRRDIEKLQEKERMLHSTFLMSLGENNKFGDYLTKVFKKRIKRSKKKDTEGDGSDEDSDDDSDDESDWSESDEESDSEAGGFDLDVCPPGCDQTLYDNTCALREKRLDIEEALAEEKKNNEALKKESEALQKKAKVIDGALKNALGELEAFQLEKQRKLNELDVVVTLRLHQIQHMVNGVLPQDLSSCLVFDESGLVRLQHRIKELEHEKAMQKKQQKEAKKKHISLIKDRRLFQSKITEMEEQCDQMMMLKFGRIVDLEKLETVTVNRNIEELKEKLRQNEIFCSNDVQKWMEKIKAKKNHITELIRENTNRLEQLTMLLGEKRELESGLDSRQKSLGGEFSGQRKADLRERQRLIQLVQLQAQEVEALKEEIMLLSRKGGHILPPAQPPAPSAPRSNMPQQ